MTGYERNVMRIIPKPSSPNAFIRGAFRIRLDSRLKHAGMTVFGKKISLTPQAANELPRSKLRGIRSEIVGWAEARSADTHHGEMMGIARARPILHPSSESQRSELRGIEPAAAIEAGPYLKLVT